ncbi:ABC transporter substrate-binding protein [bacterium]|nr:ABC transporter substrate-binding protein [bacterium]
MKSVRFILTLFVFVMFGSFTLAQSPSGTITLYTSESEQQVNEMVTLFNAAYPDVAVEIFRAGTGEVIAKLQAEMEAGEILADVLWFADIDFFTGLAEEDMLVSYIPAATEGVNDAFTYMDGAFHEVRLIFNVVAYNTTLVDEAPTSWFDLTNPAYNGLVTMPSALVSGAAFNQFGTFVNTEAFGIAFYEQLNENGIVVERANGAVSEKIASGEYAIGQLVDFFARNAAAAGSPVSYVYPVEGAMLIPTPVGILANTDNLEGAQAFLDFLYTAEAQELFVAQSYIPVLEGVALPEGLEDAIVMNEMAPEATAEPMESLIAGLPGLTIIMPDLEYIRENREALRQQFEDLFGAPPAN